MGSVRNLSGNGAENSATVGGRGGDVILNEHSRITGLGLQLWGGGYNIGGTGSKTDVISLRKYLEDDNDDCN